MTKEEIVPKSHEVEVYPGSISIPCFLRFMEDGKEVGRVRGVFHFEDMPVKYQSTAFRTLIARAGTLVVEDEEATHKPWWKVWS